MASCPHPRQSSPSCSSSNSTENLRPADSTCSIHQHQSTSSPSPVLSSSAATLLLTITCSASLTLLNKSIYTTFEFPFPFHLLALHFGSISISSRLIAKKWKPIEYQAYLTRTTWSFWFTNLLTVGIAYGSAILASNLAYLILSVSFVQMLKAFTPVILVIVTALIDKHMPPTRTSLVVIIISCGVAIAAYGEIHFVFFGALFQLIGSLAEVARLIFTQRLLKNYHMDPVIALCALSPICCLMALIMAPIFEGFDPIFLMLPRLGLPLILGSTFLALCLNIVVLFLVSSTSALVLTLAGILKDICLIFGSVLFLGSKITPTQIFGYALAASGLIYFKFSPPPNVAISSPSLTLAPEYESLPLAEMSESKTSQSTLDRPSAPPFQASGQKLTN